MKKLVAIVSSSLILGSTFLYSNDKVEAGPEKHKIGIIKEIKYYNDTGFSVNSKTLIEFQDGSVKVFKGVPDECLRIGKKNNIRYLELGDVDEIISVTVKNDR